MSEPQRPEDARLDIRVHRGIGRIFLGIAAFAAILAVLIALQQDVDGTSPVAAFFAAFCFAVLGYLALICDKLDRRK